MAKEWRVFAHPDYFISIRSVISNPDERFLVTTQIREYLKTIEKPSNDLLPVPGKLNQYYFDVMGYTVIIHWVKEYANDIRLLEIYLSVEE